jgi:methylmalonyl-CoA/ethylmalonyl-CoA epimerase
MSSCNMPNARANLFGDEAVFDHVGVAVRSIEAIGVSNGPVTRDAKQRVSVAFVETGGVTLELIEPLGDNSPVLRSIESGQTLVHLCFRVPDLERALAAGKQAGFHRLSAPTPAPAFENRRIAWVFSRTFGLVELLEAAG